MNQQEKIDYLKQAIVMAGQNASFGIGVAEGLLKDAGTLLNILLAAIGGSIGLTLQMIKLSESQNLVAGAMACVIYLSGVAAILVKKCLMSRNVYPPANSPNNLLVVTKDEYNDTPLDQVYAWTLESMEAPIVFNRDSNALMALWLDRCRLAAVLTPAAFIAGASVF